MKQLAAQVVLAIAIIALSCSTGDIVPIDVQEHRSQGAILEKCSACAIVIKVTPYYRSSDSTWCVGMRVFRVDGTALPTIGNYVWWRDATPCDSIDNWVHWADSIKCIIASGYSNGSLTLSRFAFKASYNGLETPRLIVGRDMPADSVTGCLASPCTDSDSVFRYSFLTCDSLSAR